MAGRIKGWGVRLRLRGRGREGNADRSVLSRHSLIRSLSSLAHTCDCSAESRPRDRRPVGGPCEHCNNLKSIALLRINLKSIAPLRINLKSIAPLRINLKSFAPLRILNGVRSASAGPRLRAADVLPRRRPARFALVQEALRPAVIQVVRGCTREVASDSIANRVCASVCVWECGCALADERQKCMVFMCPGVLNHNDKQSTSTLEI